MRYHRNLLANPFNCNCHLAWLGEWLRKKRIVTGNPRCQSPYFLKEIPIQDVAIQDFACEEGMAISLSLCVCVCGWWWGGGGVSICACVLEDLVSSS